MKYKVVLCSIAACMATVLTGCASSMHPFGDEYLTVSGTPEGYESFFTGLNGISQTAKNDDVHKLDNHHALMANKEATKRHGLTVRFGMPSQEESNHAE